MKKIFVFTLLFGVTFIFSMLIVRHSAFEGLDQLVLDEQFRVQQRSDTSQKVIIVAIDQSSLDAFARTAGIYWPWPRDFYALLNDYLYEDGATTVVFDILFDRPELNRTDTDGLESDQRFAESLRNYPQTVLSTMVGTRSPLVSTSPSTFVAKKAYPLSPISAPLLLDIQNEPIELFAREVNRIGVVTMNPDEDGVIRNIRPYFHIDSLNALPTLGIAAFFSELSSTQWNLTERGMTINQDWIPLLEDQRYQINWYKKGGVTEGTFQYLPFFSVIKSAIQARRDSLATRSIPKGTFKGKTVFIGASAPGLSDTRSTPFSAIEAYPGVEIHATLFANLYDGQFISSPNKTLLSVIMLVFSLFFSWLALYKRIVFTISIWVSVTLLLIVLQLGLFELFRVALPFGTLFITIGFQVLTPLAYRYYTEEREKREIKSAFSKYVQKEVVQQLVDQPEKLRLGGEKKTLTLLFSDLAGFTSLSEQMDPQDLVELLNEYLGAMTEILFHNNGTLDKYIGDAIMAFWGAPLPEPNQELLACATVREMIRMQDTLNLRWKDRNLPPAFVRFGVHTGEAVAGNMGATTRFNYTAMGDTVNLAARLEPINKMYNTSAIISETVYEKVSHRFICRPLDLIIVKGKTTPIQVFELMADREQDTHCNECERVRELFLEGLAFYRQRNWIQAQVTFGKVQSIIPNDGPSELYISRCQHYLLNPPPPNWNGVFTMKTK